MASPRNEAHPPTDRPAARDLEPTDARPAEASGSARPAPPLRRTLFRAALLLALVLLGLLILRLAVIQGLWKPVRIASGSMAPTLLGPHYNVTCDDCRFPFPIGFEYSEVDQPAICPNCGYGNSLQEHARLVPRGERVLLDRFAFWSAPPDRWSLAAFREPGHASRLAVKRVVGLPGERVAIEHGDLRIDGKLLRKSLDVLRSLAIVVHDDHFRPRKSPTAEFAQRWRPVEAATSGWTSNEDGYAFRLPAGPEVPAESQPQAKDRPDWLAYHHWLCVQNPLRRGTLSPVLDADSYNQTVSRPLHFVPDLLVRFPMKAGASPDDTGFTLSIHDGREWFRVTWTSRSQTLEVDRHDQRVQSQRVQSERVSIDLNDVESREVEFGICDQTLWLTVDRQVLLRLPYEPTGEPPHPETTPVRIACPARSLWIGKPVVLRDIHYLDPGGLGRHWTHAPIADDHCLLLGDNVPVSHDSRRFGTVARQALVGEVWPRP